MNDDDISEDTVGKMMSMVVGKPEKEVADCAAKSAPPCGEDTHLQQSTSSEIEVKSYRLDIQTYPTRCPNCGTVHSYTGKVFHKMYAIGQTRKDFSKQKKKKKGKKTKFAKVGEVKQRSLFGDKNGN